ncbi:MAG: hypothetical protein ACTSW1_01475 [Candidatus Hodarchaeales archaeon]
MYKNRRRGVSPILATVIIFGLIITGVMVTFIQVVPYIERAQSEEAISTVKNSFLDLDKVIKELISESGEPGGYRTVLMRKTAGKIVYDSTKYHFALKLIDQDSNLVYNFTNLQDGQKIGVLDWVYNSPRSIVPRGTSQYFNGPNPYEKRDPVFLTGLFATTDYQDMTNLTLSHQNDRKHHVTLSYRISAHLSITTFPEPEIKFQIFFILIDADFSTIHSTSTLLKVHSRQISSASSLLSIDPSVSQLILTYDDIRTSGVITHNLWTTQEIKGLTQISYFNVVVQKIVYEIGLSI